MYKDPEIKISFQYLTNVAKTVIEPVCVLGGWGVHLLVNAEFKAATGRNYIGSRDIDLGFNINPKWSEKELKQSSFSKSLNALEKIGFELQGFRLIKPFHLIHEKELKIEDSKRIPQSFITPLYVDFIVNRIHSKMKELFGFISIDEPLLDSVFKDKKFKEIKFKNHAFRIPTIETLLAMKMNSVQARDKEHKRIKDITDIFALTWYSGKPMPELKKEFHKSYSKIKIKQIIKSFKEKEIEKVSGILGLPKETIQRALNEFAGGLKKGSEPPRTKVRGFSSAPRG